MIMVLVLLYSYRVKWHWAMLSVNYSEFDSDNVVTLVFFISLMCGQNVLKNTANDIQTFYFSLTCHNNEVLL